MSQLEPNDFEEQWRKAFDEASEPPSEGLWSRIEQELPPEQPIGLPFFWVGVVLLFLVSLGSLGWWYSHRNDATKDSVASTPAVNLQNEGRSSEKTPAARPETKVPGQIATTPLTATEKPDASGVTSSPHTSNRNKLTTPSSVSRSGSTARWALDRNTFVKKPTRVITDLNVNTTTPAVGIINPLTLSSIVPTDSNAATRVALLLQQAATKPWSLYAIKAQPKQPTVAMPVLPGKSLPLAKFWMSLNAGIIRFNPSVSSVTAFPTYDSFSYSLSPLSQRVTPTSEPNYTKKGTHISYQLEWLAGARLSRHWYLESGVQFLRGHSTLNNNLVLIQGSGISNAFADQLNYNKSNQVPNSPNRPDPSPQGTNSLVSTNSFRYTFEYLSVPVSVGYEFRPGKRLNYFVSGGLSADFFLRNVLVDDSYIGIPPAEYGPKDGIYRNVSLSTTANAGANYRLSRKTSLNVKTFVRKSVMNGLQGDYLKIHPVTLGVGMGIRRDF
ncbi:hypothetical protein BWI93_26170 [Siphonobacter sp. BAB-5385]|uniref:outer membrane beta-barrel protein n=1 Tax=Siphonobacter sp. BAB-5385 TaxID=1864822 RepID=UPI000B9E714C|nr:outer membrane beta-barrel protein [Siphonobacter sp. BAB-5385]OZI05303.1 hypothetical protein BWI93_26170 [Siphonobacter sp. BAB-5385]